MRPRTRAAAASLQAQVTFDRVSERRSRASELAQLLGHARQSALQSAHADHAGQREEPAAAVGLAGPIAREVRGDGARRGRRALHRAGAERRRRARRRDRPRVLDLHYQPAPEARTCCGRVNRGLAILGDTLFMGTIDAHLLAIDAKSGQLIWDTTVASRQGSLLDHALAAGREGQGDRRHRRR